MPSFRNPFSRGGDRAKPADAPTSPPPEPPKTHIVKVYDVVGKLPKELPANGIIMIHLDTGARLEGGETEFWPKLQAEAESKYPEAKYRRAALSHGELRIVFDPPKDQKKYHGP